MNHNTHAVTTLLAAVAVFAVSAAIMMPFVPDDAYISFRYAEHLAEGKGLVFNLNESPVEGYSNFLWILLGALLHGAGFELPRVMPYMGIVFGALNLVVIWVIYRRRRLPALQMLLPLLMLATAGPFIMYAISGMETALFSLLLLVAVLVVDLIASAGRMIHYILLAILGFLIALCRPDGIVAFPVAATCLVVFLRRDKGSAERGGHQARFLIVSAVVFVGLIISYNLWRFSYFGQWLPTPLISKGGGGISIIYAWWMNARMYFVMQGYEFPPLGYYYAALGVVAVLGISMSPLARERLRAEQVSLVMVLMYSLAYLNFVDWMPGMRYHSALIGLILVPAAHIQSPLFAKDSNLEKRLRPRYWAVAAVILMISYSSLTSLSIITHRLESGNQKCLVALAKWMRATFPAGAVLAIADVGAIPYYSEFQTIDIRPESLTDLHIARNGFSDEYFFQRRPDVVVLISRGVFSARMDPAHFKLLKDPRFGGLYRFLGVSRYDWYEDRSYWVFIPKHVPLLGKEMEEFPAGIGGVRRIAR
jgi:hypothetical protein